MEVGNPTCEAFFFCFRPWFFEFVCRVSLFRAPNFFIFFPLQVGMVRQEGYGNLQGFTGYRAGPHTITMGYANDASLPDASGGVRQRQESVHLRF